MDKNGWTEDILGGGFESKTIGMGADYSGAVCCTVVRLRAASDHAVLYVHGFSDYFFQADMAREFVAHGYSFYAVDLRKYGRSLMEGQKMFEVRDLHEYFADIDAAVAEMKADGIAEAVLTGHSTGGLTSALYMSENPSPIFKALILNSPFLAWNLPAALRGAAIPVVAAMARLWPGMRVHQKPDPGYARSLLKEFGGEWTYRRDWKPDILPDPDAAWVRAIDKAQRALRHRKINVPILLLRSAHSTLGDKDAYSRADAILDVESIGRRGRELSDRVTEETFEGGLHDLALSRPTVRARFYGTIFGWLGALNFYGKYSE